MSKISPIKTIHTTAADRRCNGEREPIIAQVKFVDGHYVVGNFCAAGEPEQGGYALMTKRYKSTAGLLRACDRAGYRVKNGGE